MKSKFMFLAAFVAVMGLAGCSDKSASGTGEKAADCVSSSDANGRASDRAYTGVLPAADVDGIRYTVLLDYDDEGTGGEYEMVQTYFVSDSTGVSDVASFATDGDFVVSTNDKGQKYLKFEDAGAGELYFLAETDSTLTMVDASLTPASTNGMNYTLKSARKQ